jgi:hypothetical protein
LSIGTELKEKTFEFDFKKSSYNAFQEFLELVIKKNMKIGEGNVDKTTNM